MNSSQQPQRIEKISPSDVTIVYQGKVSTGKDSNGYSFRDLVEKTRTALPGAKIVLSTWRNTKVPRSVAVDEIVRSNDPGSLPPIKFDDQGSNNINRQIVTTVAGLRKVTTKYAIKLRTDAFLENDNFLAAYTKYANLFPSGSDRILTTSFFTIDPLVFEHMPFHISDWFLFSTTERLLKYWSTSPVSLEDATHYEKHKHASHSSYLDKKFRTRLAVEQYLCAGFAKQYGYETPEYHNDSRKKVLDSFRDFVANDLVILDPWQAGLKFPKYKWAYQSNMQSMNCMMFLDWYKICTDVFGGEEIDQATYLAGKKRSRQKMRVRIGNKIINPVAFIIYSRRFNPIGTRLLKWATWNHKSSLPSD